jgi:hypothetical protein
MRRRSTLLAVVLASLLAAGCSSDQTVQQVNAPAFGVAGGAPAVCPAPESLRAILSALFPAGQAPLEQFDQMVTLVNQGDETAAQQIAYDLIDQILTAYRAGQLVGGMSAGTQANVVTVVNGIFCITGINATLPPGSLDNDGAAQIIRPNSPTTTVLTGTQFAGVQVGAGTVPQTILLTIVRLPDSPGPLLTPLDQYPLFYEFTTEPVVTFGQGEVLGVCQPSNLTLQDPNRLRVAHNIAPFSFGSVEILPLAPAPFLNCTLAAQIGMGPASRWLGNLFRALSPQPLFAMAGTTGIGGTTKNFSPFGAVDTLARVDASTATKLSGTAGYPIDTRPSVTVKTLTGKPMPGITVVFSVTGGGGNVSGGTQVTDAAGFARVGNWTLGTVPGTNTLQVVATPPQGAGFLNNPIIFTATGKKK